MNHESNARTQRAWSADQKLQILKEGRSPATTLSAVCDQYAIKLPQFYQWERVADRGARAALSAQPRGRKCVSLNEEQHRKGIDWDLVEIPDGELTREVLINNNHWKIIS